MKQTKQQAMQQLYDKLRVVGEIPITERDNISSKGLYLSEQGKQEIYIKESLPIKTKLHVLLHEYSHYVHLTHYFNEESRAECEIIANGSASFICGEFKLNIFKEVDVTKFSEEENTVNRLHAQIQTVAGHILSKFNQD